MQGSLKVGITQRIVENSAYPELRDAIAHDWIPYIEEKWGYLKLIPNLTKNVEYYLEDIDLLILSGGNDVELMEGETPQRKGVNRASVIRDQFEYCLIKKAIEKSIPILGVCRGMQILNMHYKGELISVQAEEHVAKRHRVYLGDDNQEKLVQKPYTVNSYHSFGINRKSLGSELDIVAYDDKGNIESFYNRRDNVLGIMWHPERNGNEEGFTEKLITEYLKI